MHSVNVYSLLPSPSHLTSHMGLRILIGTGQKGDTYTKIKWSLAKKGHRPLPVDPDPDRE